jgi:hypothetical protein
MDEQFVSSVDEFDLRMDEIKLALKKCREQEYALAPVKAAANLIVDYIEWTTDTDLQDALLAILTKLKERRAEAARLEEEQTEKLRGETVAVSLAFPLLKNEDISIGKLYNTSLIESQRSCNDNALVFYGALESELLYIVKCYAKNRGYDLRLIDCEKLFVEYGNGAAQGFSALANYAQENAGKEIFVYSHVNALRNQEEAEEAFCFFLKKIRKETGVLQYVLNTDLTYPIERIYKDWVERKYQDKSLLNIYSGTLEFLNVSLPEFGFVKGQIRYAFKIEELDDEAEKHAKKHYYLLGYEGLSELIEKATAENWREYADKIADRNREEFEAFLKEADEDLPQYLPEDWKLRRTKRKNWTRDELDEALHNPKFLMPRNEYDTVDNLKTIQERLEKILNMDGISVRQKCGWACNYALHNGDVLNNLVGLSEEKPELAERIITERYELAYDALASLMNIQRGKIVFDIPKNGDFNGLCCDGGKTIRMNARYLDTKHPQEVLDGMSTLLHELFHALQHESISAVAQKDEKKVQYYWLHFDVTPSRIEQWKKNFSRYRGSLDGDNFKDYEDQIVEADARVFSADRLAEFEAFNPPLLD